MASELEQYIEQQAALDTLRFITCGSIDDGKSTLIGRLLYETQALFDDQVESLKSDSKRVGTQGNNIDFALLVDGLSAEREQGITIDVAYRFFNSDKRKFIVADTPGHEQYTRNMITGASTAGLAIILVDATQGILTQTRRHAYLCHLVGIKNIVLAVNKMDRVDYDQTSFQRIAEDFTAFTETLDFSHITAIPMCALDGANVVQRSKETKWYKGPTLLGCLETVDVSSALNAKPFRFPVQWVNRPHSDYRGYSGTVASGSVAVGDKIRALPSGEIAQISGIDLYQTQLERAGADQAVTLVLDREIDISRGDVIVEASDPCEVSDQFEVDLVWMARDSGYVGRPYKIKLNTQECSANLTRIKQVLNINTLDGGSATHLGLNDIARVQLNLDSPVVFEEFTNNQTLGSFILIDKATKQTVAAGMIRHALRRSQNIHTQAVSISKAQRQTLNGHKSFVVWFTGISGSGKSTLANELEKLLHARGIKTYLLDGDNIRHGINKDLGFTEADRVENIRRVAEIAKLMVDAGVVVLTAFISPFAAERRFARELFGDGEFIEVFVDTPLDVAEQRDPKGLYKKARAGEIPNFTGINSPYEAPEAAEVRVSTDAPLEDCVTQLFEQIKDSMY